MYVHVYLLGEKEGGGGSTWSGVMELSPVEQVLSEVGGECQNDVMCKEINVYIFIYANLIRSVLPVAWKMTDSNDFWPLQSADMSATGIAEYVAHISSDFQSLGLILLHFIALAFLK